MCAVTTTPPSGGYCLFIYCSSWLPYLTGSLSSYKYPLKEYFFKFT